ncbi:hypothetical protein HU200_046329 [Digitaria exilis]|uniref:Jacalin-type lectin domain-containing protein n=1 Tax=Digitaria exilis TaxID=1010633 RepID=A0A835EEX8_9POAL|nr:hypothetical protein HU200_046329 [Digitaria exilis]
MIAPSKMIRVGPWGGRDGSPWDDAPHRGVRRITVTYGRFMESIQVEYANRNGRPILGEKHGGGMGRSLSFTIELDFPYEFVTGVSGCYRAAHGGSPPVVLSLTFATTRGTAGDAGADDGVPFDYPMDGGVVVGWVHAFTGRSGWHLDALGLYVAALRPETPCDPVSEGSWRTDPSSTAAMAAGHHHQSKKKPFEWCYKSLLPARAVRWRSIGPEKAKKPEWGNRSPLQ